MNAPISTLVEPLAPMLAPERTALIVVDVQNDFGHPEGVMARLGCDLSTVDAAVDRIEALIAAARAAAVPVVMVRLQTEAALDSRAANARRARTGRSVTEDLRVCRAGRWGADFYRLVPAPSDIPIAKPRYSSFVGTELHLRLQALGRDTVLVCGLTTECCVETTVRDAFALDYHVFITPDASTAYDARLHAAAVQGMVQNFAISVPSEQVVQAWETRA